MASIQIIRQPTVANATMVYEFNGGSRFLVANFTDGDIYVSNEENATKEKSILIQGSCARIVLINERNIDTIKNIQIIPEATSAKGVEVQCLRW